MDDEDRRRIADWDAALEYSSYYELLGLLEIADEAAIRQAFHEFSLSFHPDAHPGADDETAVRLRRVFQRGAEAYRVLLDAESRADYDLSLAKGQMRLGIPSIPPGTVSTVRSLDELCRTASGKLHATKADRLISQGALEEAKRELLRAFRAEPEPDPELGERLDALDMALFAMGS
jgi:curved DNA-binding protein CbpA